MTDVVKDEFEGQGGSYVVDPKTGARVLVERTQEAGEDAQSSVPPGPVDAMEAVSKGN